MYQQYGPEDKSEERDLLGEWRRPGGNRPKMDAHFLMPLAQVLIFA